MSPTEHEAMLDEMFAEPELLVLVTGNIDQAQASRGRSWLPAGAGEPRVGTDSSSTGGSLKENRPVEVEAEQTHFVEENGSKPGKTILVVEASELTSTVFY